MSNDNICSTCLSTDRTLTPLKVLGNNIMPLPIINKEQSDICWECRTFMLKIVKFKRQVTKAQILLFNTNTKKKRVKTITSLSNLSAHHKDFYDEIIVWNEIIINDEDNVKDEKDIFDTNNDEDFKDIIKYESFEDNGMFMEVHDVDMKDEENENIEDELEAAQNSDEETDEKRESVNLSVKKDKGNDSDTDIEPVTDKEQNLENKNEFIEEIKLTKEELYRTMEHERNTERFQNASFKCETCVRVFSTDRSFEKHKKMHIKGLLRCKCTICKQTFKRKDRLEYHYEKHFIRYRCKVCKYTNTNFKVMLTHYNERHAPNKQYPCSTCDEVFDNKIELRRHNNQQHNTKQKVIYECDICGQKRLNKGNLIDHIRKHYGAVKKVPCPKCQKMYQRKYMSAHMKTHNERSEVNYCVECNITYKSQASFKRHLMYSRKHMTPDALKFPCTYCDAKFTHNVSLKCHLLSIHLKGFRYKCHICDKGFVRKLPMQEHIMEKHEGKPLPKNKLCNICGRGFKKHRTLVHHIRTHTGEKPYECDQCDARFAQKISLTLHSKRHAKNSILDKKTNEPVRNEANYLPLPTTTNYLLDTKCDVFDLKQTK